jgi:hypothetical protein
MAKDGAESDVWALINSILVLSRITLDPLFQQH